MDLRVRSRQDHGRVHAGHQGPRRTRSHAGNRPKLSRCSAAAQSCRPRRIARGAPEKMTDSLTVLLNDAAVGNLVRSPGGRLGFTYDASYQARRDVTPLSVSMPVQVQSHPDSVISPWVSNLLPDNEA